MYTTDCIDGHESGQNVVEYGLIISLTAIIVIGVWTTMGPHVESMVHSSVSDERIAEGRHASSQAIYDDHGSSGSNRPGQSNSGSPSENRGQSGDNSSSNNNSGQGSQPDDPGNGNPPSTPSN